MVFDKILKKKDAVDTEYLVGLDIGTEYIKA